MLTEAYIVYYEPSCNNRLPVNVWKLRFCFSSGSMMTAHVAIAINVSYLVTTLYAIKVIF